MPHIQLDQNLNTYYEVYDFTDPWKKPETILFVHGFTENTTAWRAWIPHLARKYRLVLFDIRGFGKTGEVSEDFPYSTDLFVEDMVKLINQISDEPVHIISGKSGAISTMRLAATKPELVKSLALTCPSMLTPGSSDWLPFMEEHGIRAWAAKTMPARLGYDMPQPVLDWWSDMMGATSISTAKAYLKWVVTTKPYLELDKIKCPVFIIMTEYSEKTNQAAGQMTPEEIKQKLPQAKFFILKKDCYHAAASDPDICAPQVCQFLDSLN
jgi:pimeloyl-ACP methyl ester carboxylesterase